MMDHTSVTPHLAEKDQLPQGWARIRLADLMAQSVTGIIPAEYPSRLFESWSVPAFQQGVPESQLGSDIGSNKQRVLPDDVLLCKINPRINRVWKVGPHQGLEQIASTEWIILRTRHVDPDYLVYALSENGFRNKLCADVAGVGGSLTRARPSAIQHLEVNLAPLGEQRRIVARVKRMLERVRATRANLNEMKPIVDHYRQSVLAAAFRGDLTADWRDRAIRNTVPTPISRGMSMMNSDSLPNGWSWVELGTVAQCDLGKMLDRSKHVTGTERPYLRNVNVRWGDIDTDDLITMFFEDDEVERYSIRKGDILVCEGGEPGRAAIWDRDETIMYQKALHRIRPTIPMNPAWITYQLRYAATIGALEQYFTGTTIKHLTGTSIRRYPLRLAPVDEQEEIVRRLNEAFGIMDHVERLVDQLNVLLATLEQSILVKAFRGELVPQDSHDEPASVLLERIRAERAQAEGGPRSRKAKQNGTSVSDGS